jgi:hypothetical protein
VQIRAQVLAAQEAQLQILRDSEEEKRKREKEIRQRHLRAPREQQSWLWERNKLSEWERSREREHERERERARERARRLERELAREAESERERERLRKLARDGQRAREREQDRQRERERERERARRLCSSVRTTPWFHSNPYSYRRNSDSGLALMSGGVSERDWKRVRANSCASFCVERIVDGDRDGDEWAASRWGKGEAKCRYDPVWDADVIERIPRQYGGIREPCLSS